MYIRKTRIEDLDTVMAIYEQARVYMKEQNNPDQWKSTYPSIDTIIEDINRGLSYVCVAGIEILAVFYFNMEVDLTYLVIDGKWLNQEEYGVIHRIAVKKHNEGIATFCLNWAFNECFNLRIDTHKDNYPMKNLLSKLGFSHCGIIRLKNNEPRLAYQLYDQEKYYDKYYLKK